MFVPILEPMKPNLDGLPGQTASDKITMADGATIDNTDEAIGAYNQMRKRAAEKARNQYNQQQRANETGRFCPFHPDSWVQPVACKKDCALWVGDSCAIAARKALTDTNGKPCPFRRRCDPSCALYAGGCSLTNTQFA